MSEVRVSDVNGARMAELNRIAFELQHIASTQPLPEVVAIASRLSNFVREANEAMTMNRNHPGGADPWMAGASAVPQRPGDPVAAAPTPATPSNTDNRAAPAPAPTSNPNPNVKR